MHKIYPGELQINLFQSVLFQSVSMSFTQFWSSKSIPQWPDWHSVEEQFHSLLRTQGFPFAMISIFPMPVLHDCHGCSTLKKWTASSYGYSFLSLNVFLSEFKMATADMWLSWSSYHLIYSINLLSTHSQNPVEYKLSPLFKHIFLLRWEEHSLLGRKLFCLDHHCLVQDLTGKQILFLSNDIWMHPNSKLWQILCLCSLGCQYLTF